MNIENPTTNTDTTTSCASKCLTLLCSLLRGAVHGADTSAHGGKVCKHRLIVITIA